MASSSYLHDYSHLWSRSLTPHWPSPPSPPRRSATSSTQDARRQQHEAALRNLAQAQAVHRHARGEHLPARRRGGTARKERIRMAERDADWTWSGAGVTEQEGRELSDEEETRMTWRDNLLSYGRNDIVVLGRGRTTAEELRDQEDREALAQTHAANAAANGHSGNASVSGVRPANGRRTSRGTATTTTAAAARRRGGAGARGADGAGQRRGSGQSANSGDGDASPTGAGAGPPGGDPYAGEYTLDDGDAGGAGGGGGGVDLDAGVETFD